MTCYAQAALGFATYFDKLSKRFAQLSTYCPRLGAYEQLFQGSTRLQSALSDFYAIIVKFCSQALRVLAEYGNSLPFRNIPRQCTNVRTLGAKRFAKSFWKGFKGDFGQLEENLSAAKVEVDQEIRLAAEQKLHEIYQQQQIDSRDAQFDRTQRLIEVRENRDFRSQQTLALVHTKELQVQKAVKEEGMCLNYQVSH